jgi:hypothetical protein
MFETTSVTSRGRTVQAIPARQCADRAAEIRDHDEALNMSRQSLLPKGTLLIAVVATLGCASSHIEDFPGDAATRPLTDGPTQFAASSTARTRLSTDICQSPLYDQRSGTTLRLERSVPGRGDYEVPTGQYGAQSGDLVRVDCRTLQPIGLVRR